MDINSLIKDNIKQAIRSVYSLELDAVALEHPDNEKWGDYASNVSLVIAPQIKQTPMEIAKKISYELQSYEMSFERDGKKYPIFEKIDTASPGFINFKYSPEWLYNVLYRVEESANNYGAGGLGKGNTILVEFSQPNTNKPMHIGHARNNFLGSSISNILQFQGYKVIRSNYVGDIGIHIAKSMLMYLKYGNGTSPESSGKKPDHFVGDFYIRFEEESESNPELLEEARELLRKWEAGDPETVELWKKMNDWVYEGWKKTYEDENVDFDIWEYESASIEVGKEIADVAVKQGVAEKDDTGAIIARLETYGLPDKVLLRSDGTSVYSTKDLQLAKNSYEKYHFDKRLYVVDSRQADYFKQIFKILEILGFTWAKNLYHVSYGLVKLKEGQMSSRKGLVINADDVYARLVSLEKAEIESNTNSRQVSDETAERVALAAFRYGMLKVDSAQDITFDYSYVTKFDGNTGPYLLYTFARACSILKKAEEVLQEEEPGELLIGKVVLEPQETDVLRELDKFPEVVKVSEESFSPNLISNYLFTLSHNYNTLYSQLPVLSANTVLQQKTPLKITRSVKQVLQIGLNLLGIQTVEKM